MSTSSSKSLSKRSGSSSVRDKNKSVASESGSSQCDTPPLTDKVSLFRNPAPVSVKRTPPLTEKDGASTSQGKFAGVGPDSIHCMAEQVGAELNAEAATNLAEDVSYKLRQTIATIALHSEMMKKSRVDPWDVNSVLMLSDTSPVVGTSTSPYAGVDDKVCCQVENLINVSEFALNPQTYSFSSTPTLTVEWITDERSLNTSGTISASLQTYYTKVARAILNLRRKPKEIAVEDLNSNTRIGPIFPNLFNLAVLVLNDDNLNALNVPAKKPLQSNVLDMVDALCSNPCCLDTNIQQQFQRLFPVMVSNILGNGSLAGKMVAILTKITRTWPSFILIGKTILFDYLSQGTKERLTAPMIRCVLALGRSAVVQCLGDHLDHLDARAHMPRRPPPQPDLREALLDVSTCLLRSEPTTYLEDFVMTDYTLYEMLGDSIMPRRTIFPHTDSSNKGDSTTEKTAEEDFYLPHRPVLRPRLRIVATIHRPKPIIPRNAIFEHAKFRIDRPHIRIKCYRCKELPITVGRPVLHPQGSSAFSSSRVDSVVAASGLLNRFKFRLNKHTAFPIYGAITL